MILYYIPIILLSLMIIKKNQLENIIVIILGLFLCTTYFNGSDWRSYELMYNNLDLVNFSTFTREKGYYLYMLFFKRVGLNFWSYFILTKICCFYIFYLKIKEYTTQYSLSLLLLYGYIYLYFFIDCPLRNLIAITIFLISETSLRKNKKLCYFFYMIIAYNFHNSAIVMIFPIFFKNIYKMNRKVLIIIVIGIFIFFSNYDILMKLLEYIPLKFKDKIVRALEAGLIKTTIFSFGTIEKLIVIFCVIWNKEKILKKTRKNRNIIMLCLLYFLFYRLALSISILGRLNQYFIIFYVLAIVNLVNLIKNIFWHKIIILFSLLYVMFLTYNSINQNYKYLPYTSYISYLFREKPSFAYRDNYNFEKLIENSKKNGKNLDLKQLKLSKERLKRNAGY